MFDTKIPAKTTDALYFAEKTMKLGGCADDTVRFLEKTQLLDASLWKRFVNQYRDRIDGENRGWRGEYWGKMMRGACFVYEYSKNPALYEVLKETVLDMMTTADEDGRVSSFTRETEFDAWDLWGRKYVLLGMEYFYDICPEEDLKADIVRFISRAADHILLHIGDGEGQKAITVASRHWRGVNSSSILEPIVWLYRLTGEQRYFDFATYIIGTGGADGVNIFERAYENKLYPYQYGVTKAYETISCFEGLIEYYRITGIEKYLVAAVNFGKAIIDSDITVIGTAGCTHELFDHSKARQTSYYEGIMQETCVTVTWMKYCSQLLRLTGERVFADCIEQSFYNAYLGALNTEQRRCPYADKKFVREGNDLSTLVDIFQPFDSYSPLIPGKRGQKIGGLQYLKDHAFYGCCTCIGAAGVGIFLRTAVMRDRDGIVVNFFENGEATVALRNKSVTIKTETKYPADGAVRLKLFTETPTTFDLKVRIPEWSERTEVVTEAPYTVENGYAVFSGTWVGMTEITFFFDMSIRVTKPISWDTDVIWTKGVSVTPTMYSTAPITVTHKPEEDDYVSLSRGPLVLGADSRTGKSAASAFSFKTVAGEIDYRVTDDKEIAPGSPCLVNLEFESESGETFRLVDYASAGRDWETVIAAWLPTK